MSGRNTHILECKWEWNFIKKKGRGNKNKIEILHALNWFEVYHKNLPVDIMDINFLDRTSPEMESETLTIN